MLLGLLHGCQGRPAQNARLVHGRLKDLPRDVHRQDIGKPQEIPTSKIYYFKSKLITYFIGPYVDTFV